MNMAIVIWSLVVDLNFFKFCMLLLFQSSLTPRGKFSLYSLILVYLNFNRIHLTSKLKSPLDLQPCQSHILRGVSRVNFGESSVVNTTFSLQYFRSPQHYLVTSKSPTTPQQLSQSESTIPSSLSSRWLLLQQQGDHTVSSFFSYELARRTNSTSTILLTTIYRSNFCSIACWDPELVFCTSNDELGKLSLSLLPIYSVLGLTLYYVQTGIVKLTTSQQIKAIQYPSYFQYPSERVHVPAAKLACKSTPTFFWPVKFFQQRAPC